MDYYSIETSKNRALDSTGKFCYVPLTPSTITVEGRMSSPIGWNHSGLSGTIGETDVYIYYQGTSFNLPSTADAGTVNVNGVTYDFFCLARFRKTGSGVVAAEYSDERSVTWQINNANQDNYLTAIYVSRAFWTVSYDANGGTVNPASASTTYNGTVTLPTPTLANATFLGWYNGSTRAGGAGDSYAPTADVTLTARWSVETISGNLKITDGTSDVKVGSYSFRRDSSNGTYTVSFSVEANANVAGLGLGEAKYKRFEIYIDSSTAYQLVGTLSGGVYEGSQAVGVTIPQGAYVRAMYWYRLSYALIHNQNNSLAHNASGALLCGPVRFTCADGNIYGVMSPETTVTMSWGSDAKDLDILAFWDSPVSGSPTVGWKNNTVGTNNGYTVGWSGDDRSVSGSETCTVRRSNDIVGSGVFYVYLNFYEYDASQYPGNSCTVTATQNGVVKRKENVSCGIRSLKQATLGDPCVRIMFDDSGILTSIETD